MKAASNKDSTQLTVGRETRSRSHKKDGIFERPHKCMAVGCRKAFTRPEHLRRHQLNHTPSQIWACDKCTATFVRDDLWRRHLAKIHGEHVTSSKQSESPSRNRGVSSGLKAIKTIQLKAPTNSASLSGQPEISQPLTYDTFSFATELGQGVIGESLHRKNKGSKEQEDYVARADAETTSTSRHVEVVLLEESTTDVAQFNKEGSFSAEVTLDLLSELQDTLDWESGFGFRYPSLNNDQDLSWLFEHPLQPDRGIVDAFEPHIEDQCLLPAPNVTELGTTLLEDYSAIGGEATPFDTVPIPIYEPDPKKWRSQAAALNCRFRICRALTEERRLELLAILRHLPQFDLTDPVFSGDSLRHGIHLYAGNMSVEHSIFHPQIFAPSKNDVTDIEAFYGEEAPVELVWAVITLGWTLRLNETKDQRQIACKIQRVLRQSVINHPKFTQSPSLWIIQTLFLLLIFARYYSLHEDYAFTTFYHSVLLGLVQRFELKADSCDYTKLDDPISAKQEWLKWIKTETMRKILFHAFVLDVQHRVLHGGVICVTPFELNLELPKSELVWCSEEISTWIMRMKHDRLTGCPRFLAVIKRFWNSSTKPQFPLPCPRTSRIIMYGIVSIACEMRLRDDNQFSGKTRDAILSLNSRVRKSFESWLTWFATAKNFRFDVVPWKRNCPCMFRLAHTLYEITSVDLQTVAGKEVIEGRRVRPSDYTKSKRKVKTWVKEERALIGLSYAATIIQDRLSPSFSLVSHCHHCYWCLYLAGLICWNFGFALSGSIINHDLVSEFLSGSDELAKAQCDDYLSLVVGIQSKEKETITVDDKVKETSGLLFMLIKLLQEECYSGLIEESVELLKRLAGLISFESERRHTGI